jgi:hypothetical protein
MTGARYSGTRLGQRTDESGSTLIIALFFATIFSLFVVSVVTFTAAGLKASSGFVGQGKTASSANGAIDTAIKRRSMGGPCGEPSLTGGAANASADFASPSINGQATITHCDSLTGAHSAPVGPKPQDALLSLGTAAGEGLQTTENLHIQGDVFSNSTIDAGTGKSMVVTGNISAVGDCTANVSQATLAPSQQAYVKDCANFPPAADTVEGTDPDYPAPVTAVPVRQTVPGCSPSLSPPWLVPLAPGYYDDADALSALTSGTSCHGTNIMVWLQPGIYYFDFTFRGPSATWTVNRSSVNVVGGTPIGWSLTASSKPPIPNPGACDNTQLNGVQLMMGGGSQLKVSSGKVELCAPATGTNQRVAVYGVPPAPAVHHLMPAKVDMVTNFASPERALTIGEKAMLPGCPAWTGPPGTTGCSADATLDGSTPSASMRLSGFVSTVPTGSLRGFVPTVPPGSVIQSATLRVNHQDDGALTDPTKSVSVTAVFNGIKCGTDSGKSNGVFPLMPRVGVLFEDHINLMACGLTDPLMLNDFKVTYAVNMDSGGAGAIDRLDGIWLDVAYRTPVTFKATAVSAPSGLTASNTSSPGFTNATNAVEIGEQPTPLTADVALSSTSTVKASITLAGYSNPPIPPRAPIVSAVMRVAHAETGLTAEPTVTVAFAAGGSCTLPLGIQSTGIADDRVSLSGTPCNLVSGAQLAGMTATFNAALATNGTVATDSLDGITLELVYDTPAVTRAAVTATLSTFNNPDNALVIGEAPTAPSCPAPPPTGTTTCTADADLTNIAGGNASATITLGDYVPLGTITPGSLLDSAPGSALLHIAHQDIDTSAPSAAPPDPMVTLSGPDLPVGCTAAQPLPHRSTLTSDPIDLTLAPCSLTDPAQLNGVTVKYEATLGTTGSSSATYKLDGIALDLRYHPAAPYEPAAAISTATASTAAFTPADNAKTIGEQPIPLTASAMLTTDTAAAKIDLSGFDSVPMAPGSVIDKVTLQVAHQDDDTTTPAPPTPSPPTQTWSLSGPGYMGTCTAAQTHGLTTRQGALGTDSIEDLKTFCGLTDPAQFTGLTIRYSAALVSGSPPGSTATDQLDGVELDVVFRAPTIEPLSGCLTQAPYPTTMGSCALIASSDAAGTTGQTSFVVQGTVYAPAGALDIQMSNVSSQLFTRGLIARTIDLAVRPTSSYTRPIIGVPPEPVLFTAFPAMTHTATTAASPVGSSAAFANPVNAKVIDGTTADATLGGTNSSASLSLGGYEQAAALPDGPISHAILRVTHQDDTSVGPVSLSVAFAGSACSGTATPPALMVPPRASPAQDQFDLTACGLDATSQLAGLSVTYTATLATGATSATDHLDGIEMVVVDTPAGTRGPQSVTNVGPPGSTYANKDNALTIDGTTADASLTSMATSASLNLDGYERATPAGQLEHAILRVSHQDDGEMGPVSLSVGFTGDTATTGSTCDTATSPSHTALPLPLRRGTLVVDQVDLTVACGLTNTSQVTGLTVTYTATLSTGGASATEHLDGTELVLESGPSVRASVSFAGTTATVQQWSVVR